jgi:hypothetical protein
VHVDLCAGSMSITIERAVEASPEVYDLIGELNDVVSVDACGGIFGPIRSVGLRCGWLRWPSGQVG